MTQAPDSQAFEGRNKNRLSSASSPEPSPTQERKFLAESRNPNNKGQVVDCLSLSSLDVKVDCKPSAHLVTLAMQFSEAVEVVEFGNEVH